MAEHVVRARSTFLPNEWTKLGALEKQEEINQLAVDPAEPGNVTTRGIKNTASAQTQNFVTQDLKAILSAGEIVIGLTVHFFSTTTAVEKTFALNMSYPGLAAKSVKPTTASKKWWSFGTSGANGAMWTRAELEAAFTTGEPQFGFSSEKAASQTVFEMYFVLITESSTSPQAITATFAGVGALAAKPNAPLNLRGVFAGVGGVTDKPNTPRQLAAAFPGTGLLTATVNTPRRLASAFAGTSTFTAAPHTPRQLAATFAGVGSLVSRLNVPQKLRATFAGSGVLSAVITAFKSVTAQRTPTRFALTSTDTGVTIAAGTPSRVALDGAAARVAVTNPPSRLVLDPQTTKVVT